MGNTHFSGAVISENGFQGTGNSDSLGMGKITQTVTYDEFTDGGATSGTFDLTTQVPAGAVVLSSHLTALTGFAGDTSATIQVGDGTDVDRYSTATPDVFSTVAGGLDLGVPSGARFHDGAETVTITITSAADFTSVNAGSLTIEILYLS